MAFTIKQGDQRPYFFVVLKDNYGEEDEEIVNSAGATGVVFSMRQKGGTAVKVNRGAATLGTAPHPDQVKYPGGTAAEVTYRWGTADLDTPGTYEAEVELAWSDGKPETFPSDGYWDVIVTDDIA